MLNYFDHSRRVEHFTVLHAQHKYPFSIRSIEDFQEHVSNLARENKQAHTLFRSENDKRPVFRWDWDSNRPSEEAPMRGYKPVERHLNFPQHNSVYAFLALFVEREELTRSIFILRLRN